MVDHCGEGVQHAWIRRPAIDLLEDEHWDFFYPDIYRLRRYLPPPRHAAGIGDMAALCSAKLIGTYHWWSIEQAVLEVLHAGLAHLLLAWMLDTYLPFLGIFAEHTSAESAQLFGCGLSVVEELEHYGLVAGGPSALAVQQPHVVPGGLPVRMMS